jgi:beta-glucosidase-like glycosyl hydrolase/CubicO group peptidase (beta-lactamase class C family)
MFIRYIAIFVLSGLSFALKAQQPSFIEFLNDPWLSNHMDRMTLQEKIGQLIMIEVYPDQSELHRDEIERMLKRYKPGGILMMRGTPTKTTRWINSFQQASEVPLLVSMDAESGPGFRIDSLHSFPSAQAAGAIQNDSLLYWMGRAVGRQLKRMGINMNFAPVADVNTNPANPIINFRSFGEQKENVARKSMAYAKGMQDEGIAAVAKHFPGHGDTRSDSHHTLPVLQHNTARMDSVELVPFKHLTDNGIAGIMTAHVSVPSLDALGKPASLSAPVIQKVLREKMGYQGLVITDAMNMKGVTMPSGQAEVQALKAGNDMVEFVANLPRAFLAIENAVKEGTLSMEEIDLKCRRVLALKRWLNLQNVQAASTERIVEHVNSPENELVIRQLTEASLTILRNRNILPLMRLDTLKIATVNLGETSVTPFQQMVSRYTEADHFFLPADAPRQAIDNLTAILKSYNLVITGIHGLRSFPGRNYGVGQGQSEAIRILTGNHKTISLFFGNAYALRFFPGIENSAAIILAYQDNRFTQELTVQALFGAIDITGKLPVTVDQRFRAGSGLEVKKNGRLKYTIPEEVGISGEILARKIDSIALEGLKEKAYPGIQVLVAKEGKVIFHKCYGYLTYENTEPLVPESLYDWASVTKVSGPLPALMKLYDEGKFDLNQRLGFYWKDFAGSGKENLRIRDILTHQAQLRPIIPLWQTKFARDARLRNEVFKSYPYSETDIRVGHNLYMPVSYIDEFFKDIKESTLLTRKSYNYSCVGFHLWPRIIENLTGKPYEDYLKETFYHRLGANTITYNAYLHFPQERIVPTEVDDYFRMETLRGFVHDEGAAILGGISGNAGLFGTANDLAKLFQMYLWKGYYAGERFFSEQAFDEFNRVQFPGTNRRALGFDKPDINNHLKKPEEAYPAAGVSANSFGHTGYTGTFVWADPDNGLLVIVFTNRVHPTRNNNKLSWMGIRGSILQSVYDSAKNQ